MNEGRRFWYLASRFEDSDGDSFTTKRAFAEEPLGWFYEGENESVTAPMLFTSQEEAEAQLRRIQRDVPDAYVAMAERYGEDATHRTYIDLFPIEVRKMDKDLVLRKLEDSTFLCVMVDGRMKLRRDLIEELGGSVFGVGGMERGREYYVIEWKDSSDDRPRILHLVNDRGESFLVAFSHAEDAEIFVIENLGRRDHASIDGNATPSRGIKVVPRYYEVIAAYTVMADDMILDPPPGYDARLPGAGEIE